METFKSILVDIDASVLTHPALERAARLARRSGARLTITDVMTVPWDERRSLPPDVEEKMVSDRRQQLARVADAMTGLQVETRLLFGRPASVLIEDVLRCGHDLLMRSQARDQQFGAVDMELLRKCPCPVFLVRHGAMAPHPTIVAAINASTSEKAERALNDKIVELTLLMADLEHGLPTLLQAWRPYAEQTMRTHAQEDVFAAYVNEARERAATDLGELKESFGSRLPGLRTVHERGTPETAITRYVMTHGIDLVVMGTVARAGIRGLLIGNTAERILGKLPCSVLAVKPDDFVSPVKLA